MRAFVVGVVLVLAGCQAQSPSAPSAPASPQVVSPSPTPGPDLVRLAISAYNDSGTLLDAWPRQAIVTLEATPVCATSLRTQGPPRLAALEGTKLEARRTSVGMLTVCGRPQHVDWRVTGASCELLGALNGPAVRLTCQTAGFVTVAATARSTPTGTELGRGDAVFRVLP